jgi:alpha-mannosidase
MGHQLVLLSPYAYPGAYPLTLADDDMAAWLNGYTSLWHPALLWKADGPPRVESPYDHETPKPATIYAVPESPPNYLPENWLDRVREAGSMTFRAAADRPTTLDNLRVMFEADVAPPLGWPEALAAPQDMLNLFFGLGLGHLLQATLAEAMEHENLLEKTAFWDAVQKSIEVMGSEEEPGQSLAPPSETANPALPSPLAGEGPGVRGDSDAATSEQSQPPLGDSDSPSPPTPLPPGARGAAGSPPTALPQGERGADASSSQSTDAWLDHLRVAAQKLLAAREVLYPVAIHWLDLCVLSEGDFDKPLPAAIELGVPTNLVASASVLEKLSRHAPEKFAIVKALVERETVEVCGGDFLERDDALLPYDSQLWNLREGLTSTKRLTGQDVRVYARRRFGFHPRTVQLLASHGVTKLLFILFDDVAGIPSFHTPTIAFTAPDGKQIDAFVRPPKPGGKIETYFNLGNTWFKTTREDHSATVCIAHDAGSELPWHRDLVALSRLAPVLGTWTTFSQYLSQVSPGEYPVTPVADDFHHDALSERTAAKASDPVSGFVRHWRTRRRIDSCWTYAALHRALCGESDSLHVADHLESIERVFETQPTLGVEPGGLTEIETQVTQALAERLQSRSADNQPGVMLLNPCGFPRRYVLELEGATAPISIEGVVKACQFEKGVNRVVVEAPALGFAWIPRSGPPGTPPMPHRLRMADAKSLTIRNEFFEAEVDSQTGGLKGIRDLKTLINRIGQKLVFNPGSRPVARKVEVTSSGPALGEIIAEGVLLGEQDQELATFTQRFRAWLGRPLLEMRIELTPKQPPAGYPWHAYFAARFAWRDERAHLFRGLGGCSFLTTHPRPQSPEFLDLRMGRAATAIFPNGLPFHQKQDGRMVDVILVPEGETATTFDLGIALDRDQPMLTAWGLASPLAVVPTTKGPPHVGASGWLFHLDLPSLILTRLLPGTRERIAGPERRDAIVAQLLECSGFPAHAELRCVRNPKRAVALTGQGDFSMDCYVREDAVTIDVAAHDWAQVQIEFGEPTAG